MPKAAPIIDSFNAGEFSPLMAGRVTLKYYPNACRRIRNFILTPQGPARRRPGTRYVAAVKNSNHRTWLGRFEFNVEQAYVTEFGDLYIRFFSQHGVVGAPLEVVSPWPIASLTGTDGTFQLRMVQSNDVQYIVHDDYQPRKLTRTGAAAFSLSSLETQGGPFKDVDPDETRTVFASANTGSGITLAASAAIFQSGHVGSLFYLEQKNVDDIKQWETAKAINAADVRRSDGKNYTALNTATTGSVRPTHSFGAKYDGNTGVQWQFDDPGYGWVKITAVPAPTNKTITNCADNGSGLIRVTAVGHGWQTGWRVTISGVTGTTEANGTWTVTRVDADNVDLDGSAFANAYVAGGTGAHVNGSVATADVQSRIPDGATGAGNKTSRWAHAAWSDVEGWPNIVTFFKERLVFMRGRDGWMSVAGDFENFRRKDDGGQVTADMSIVFTVESDRSNRIEWAAPSDIALLVGTAGDEHAITAITQTEAFGPGNVQVRKQTEYGARHVPSARIGDGVVFVQKAGRKIRDMRLAESVNERWIADDVTVLAEHVTKGGIIDMAYQQEPDSVLWSTRGNDGRLLGFTLNREQEVRGWHPHRIGGYSDALKSQFAKVESVVTIPAPDGDRDELWMIVQRYINGAIRRQIEWVEYHHEEGDDPDDVFYVDSGLTLDNVINATLTPGTGATVKDTTGVSFTASGAVFSGATGKFIQYRYSTVDVKGAITWHRAVAEITAVNGANTIATATVHSPWPNLSVIAANGWRLTVTSITGLGHLAGETVEIVGDGAVYPSQVVTAGGALPTALDPPAGKVHVGLACHSVIQPMPIEAGSADGTAQGKTQRISRCIIRFHETLGAKYGRDEDTQLDEVQTRSPDDNMDEAPPLFTGDKVVSWPDGYDSPALITIVQDQPLPCTVVALMPQLTTQDGR